MSIAFDSPWYLIAWPILLPLLIWASIGGLAGLGRWRWIATLLLRVGVVTLLVFALADMQYRQKSDKLTVLYLLDQSLSIPEPQKEAMLEYVNESIRKQMREDRDDEFGVIVFGREAEVESPPLEFAITLPRVETLLDGQYTNLAGALQRARALFPDGTARRIVVVTDGNENLGDALREARALTDAGVSIDVLPVALPKQSEIAVEKLTIPADVRQDQPFELRVVMDNDANPGSKPVPGQLRIVRKNGQREETLSESPVELKPGKSVFSINEKITSPDFYTYEAQFTADNRGDDSTTRNNNATAFTHVRGQGHVLLIENADSPGEFDVLVERIRAEGLEVTVQPSNQLFTSLPELQRYDTVVLANVPRSSGEDFDSVSGFSDAQIDMLVRNTEELGCGLVMLGGDNSFGAGGWANTDIEKALPVDCQIKSAKVIPVGALAMMMHACEMPQGNFWQKKITQEAIKVLGPRDYCGIIQWNMTDSWLWDNSKGGMSLVGPSRARMLGLIDRMSVGDMPTFGPAMDKAAASFAQLPQAAVKHMIIISDGDPTPPTPATLNRLKNLGVKCTTVVVGAHGAPGMGNMGNTMQNIANVTGGKYYVVQNANALPRIFQREARRVARPLMFEPPSPITPYVVTNHEMLRGIEGGVPPIRGYVLTSVKESPLVEVILRCPLPPEEANSTLCASWTYGLGKSVAFTTDVGRKWAPDWPGWANYDQFFTQMIRWSMRPSGDTGNFSVATQVEDGKTRVVIDAIDAEDKFINVQSITGTVVGPNMEPLPLVIEQVAPGRYVGEFDSLTPGSYLISVLPGGDAGMIRTGVNVGYSKEFRDRETNLPLLETMAELTPTGGERGTIIGRETGTMLTGSEKSLDSLLASDSFRHDLPSAVATQSVWPWLVLLASVLFVGDVFVRRVQMGTEWIGHSWNWLAVNVFGRQVKTEEPATLDRLRSRKREVQESLESRRTATRFEIDDVEATPSSPLAELQSDQSRPKPQPTTPDAKPEEPDAPGYTSRLLKAKRDVWKDKEK